MGETTALEPRPPRQTSVTKLGIIAVLSLGAGFLAHSSLWVIKVTHVHVSLASHHRTAAFCAFAPGHCQGGSAEVVTTSTTASTPAVTAVTAATTAATVAAEAGVSAETLTKWTEALSKRVCGSPAIDGYAHVVPKCLEDSPTAAWWKEYYQNGGKQEDLVVHIEKAADYDGLAVVWGIGNKKLTVEECAAHCKRHMPNTVNGPFEKLPCNAFAWCPDETCFEPDAHAHHKGDCWLKFTEGPAFPEVNMRGDLPDDYRRRHPTAPKTVQWWSGVLLPAGVKPTNGTWGPRWKW